MRGRGVRGLFRSVDITIENAIADLLSVRRELVQIVLIGQMRDDVLTENYCFWEQSRKKITVWVRVIVLIRIELSEVRDLFVDILTVM